jgi:two-component system phosphate regulon sensor histidine kinase PhoR
MWWIILCAVVGSTIAFAWIAWRKLISPWREVERLIEQTTGEEPPQTFLIGGGARPRAVGLALENLFNQRRHLTKQLAKRESGTQTIFAAMQDGLLVVDSNRRVILANETFRKLFAAGEIAAGEPILDAVREPALERLISATLQKGQGQRAELSVISRHLELNAVPTRNEAGEITGTVVLLHDITELKNVDQMRSDFVANVSHELRTPLSILRGYIETLREMPQTSRDDQRRILAVMERHSKRLDLLVDDLLTLAQLESTNSNLQVSNVRIDDLFLNVVRDWEKKFAEKKLQAIVDLAPGLTTVPADATRLQEIIYNLLDNAVKYSNLGGEIHLRTEKLNGEVALSVSDNGSGIGPEDLPRIFERFYRADKARSRELGGTGLGLSIVKHIAQTHGGRVEAESEIGRGTTVRVILPAQGSVVTES